MKKIAIYGAGGFGKETSFLISQINQSNPTWDFIGFFDDFVSGDQVLGGLDDLNSYSSPLHLVVAIANPDIRENIVSRIYNDSLIYTTLIAPSVIRSDNVKIGEGSIITANCVLTVDIEIKEHVIVNLSSIIGHDVSIESFCSIMPGVNVSGNVTIQSKTLVGAGATILQNLTLGGSVQVGAGAVVVRNVSDGCTVVGIPAKPVNFKQ